MHEVEDARKKARLTVRELCDAIGISRSAYYRKIKGISDFTVRDIEGICKVLKVKPSIFFNH